MEQGVRDTLEDLDVNGWFDLWHTHIDWDSKANAARHLVAEALLRILRYLEDRLRSRQEPIQAWAALCENTGDSAVYLHSPNPNGQPFPYAFQGVEWNIPSPADLLGIDRSLLDVGQAEYDGEVVVFVRRRA